jgi:hypothetical protein
MQASEVRAQLFAGAQAPLELVEGPKGSLPEFGDLRASSVNARYLFAESASRPSHLVVGVGTVEHTFQLVRGQEGE